MSSLYDLGAALSQAFAEVDALLEANDGEYTPEMAARIDAAEGAWSEKVERVALYCRSLLGQALITEHEERRLCARRKSMQRQAEWLKDAYLGGELERHGRAEVKSALATVRVGLNPPSVECDVDVSAISVEWVRVKPAVLELDKKMVLDAHKRGEEIPAGVRIVRTKSVRIT